MIGIGRNLAQRPTANVWQSGAALDFNFAEDMCVYPRVGRARLQCTRSGATATVFNRYGVLETVPADTPRINHDPSVLRFENYVRWSERPDLSPWSTSGGTVTITPNYSIAPNGTATAARIQFSGANQVVSQSTALSAGVVCSAGIYIRGVAGETITIAAGGVDQSIVLTGGWQRALAENKTSTNGYININTYIGATARDIEVWGAQLNSGSTALEYKKTGASPFPKVYACKGLLVEETRPNKLLQAMNFGSASWSKTGATVSSAATAGPTSSGSFDKLVESATTGAHEVYQSTSKAASPLAYAFQVKVKAGERTKLQMLMEGATGNASVTFDLSAGTAGATTTASGFSGAAAKIDPLGGGAYLCSLVATTNTDTVVYGTLILKDGSGSNSYPGDGTSGLYIGDAQLEPGAFATSFILTSGSAVTRNADDITVSGLPLWFNATSGIVVCEFDGPGIATDGTGRIPWSIGDSASFNESMYVARTVNSTAVTVNVIDGGVGQISANSAGNLGATSHRIAFAYAANDFAWSVNGAAASTDTVGTLPTVNKISLGNASWGGSNYLCGHIRSFQFFSARPYSNSDLPQLAA